MMRKNPKRWTRMFILNTARARKFSPGFLAMIVLAAGCASVPERHPLPEAPKELPQVHGIPDARLWGDEQAATATQFLQASPEEVRARNPGIANTRTTIWRSPAAEQTEHSVRGCSPAGPRAELDLNSTW
jgi:hypothetical protein